MATETVAANQAAAEPADARAGQQRVVAAGAPVRTEALIDTSQILPRFRASLDDDPTYNVFDLNGKSGVVFLEDPKDDGSLDDDVQRPEGSLSYKLRVGTSLSILGFGGLSSVMGFDAASTLASVESGEYRAYLESPNNKSSQEEFLEAVANIRKMLQILKAVQAALVALQAEYQQKNNKEAADTVKRTLENLQDRRGNFTRGMQSLEKIISQAEAHARAKGWMPGAPAAEQHTA